MSAPAKLALHCADRLVSQLTLGPGQPGTAGHHWSRMVAQPGERVFYWHQELH